MFFRRWKQVKCEQIQKLLLMHLTMLERACYGVQHQGMIVSMFRDTKSSDDAERWE